MKKFEECRRKPEEKRPEFGRKGGNILKNLWNCQSRRREFDDYVGVYGMKETRRRASRVFHQEYQPYQRPEMTEEDSDVYSDSEEEMGEKSEEEI